VKRRHQATNQFRQEPVIALSAIVLGADGKAPQEWPVFTYGVNTSDKGNFIFDERAAKLVMAAFAKKGSSLTMDYEHQALNAPENGQPAPNSCYSWTPEIRANAAGKPELWATNAKWTIKASGMIESKEYLYFSPAFETEPETMRVSRIVNMALTNVPALDNLKPLVAATTGDRPMKNALCYSCSVALKFPTDDDDGDKVACVACSTRGAAQMTTLSAVVGLKADAGRDAVLATISDLASFRTTVVALTGAKTPGEAAGLIIALKARAEEVNALTAQLETEREARLRTTFDGILVTAGKEGRIEPSQHETLVKPILKASGGKVTELAIEMLSAAISIIPAKVVTAGGEKQPDPAAAAQLLTGLTEDDKKIARLTGIAPVAIIEHKKHAVAGDYNGMQRPLMHILQP
jgi:phage I-like protein